MKNMKKILALVLALMLVLGMTSALAATIQVNDTTTIATNDDPTGHHANHEYTVYQVFTGTIEDGTLVNVKYGDDYVGKTAGDDVPKAELDAITDAKAFAATFLALNLEGKGHKLNSENNFTLTGQDDGYYIIVDSSNPMATGDALSATMVQVLGDTVITPKKDTVTDEKTIASDGLGKNVTDHDPDDPNNKIDDVSIGDVVNYKIEATIPAHATDYNYFYFVITDKMEPGLTLVQNSIVVNNGDKNLVEGTDYQIKKGAHTEPKTPNLIGRTGTTEDGYTFEIGLNDARSMAGKKITVTFQAILNEDAELGEEHNDNTSTVIFSNNPNHDYDGKNNPAFPAQKDKDALGETPKSITETYTTGLKIIKVDEEGNPLKGAKFSIAGDILEKVVNKRDTFVEATGAEAVYYKLKNGTYTTEAPDAKEHMELKGIADANTTAGYVVDPSYTGEGKKEIGGKVYRPYAPATDVGKAYYVLQTGNAYLYESETPGYKKTTVTEVTDATTNSYKVEKTVNEDGIIEFDGLGEGVFTIHETAPTGYNAIPDFVVDIKFTYNPATGEAHWSKKGETPADVTYDSTAGVFTVTVENKKGNTLPSTGGIGTTIFYVGGGILVLLAVVLLVTKRRMSSND